MKFEITLEQLNFVLQRLGKVESDISYDPITLLRSLPKIEEKKEEQDGKQQN